MIFDDDSKTTRFKTIQTCSICQKPCFNSCVSNCIRISHGSATKTYRAAEAILHNALFTVFKLHVTEISASSQDLGSWNFSATVRYHSDNNELKALKFTWFTPTERFIAPEI
jgi:hypothetical protein